MLDCAFSSGWFRCTSCAASELAKFDLTGNDYRVLWHCLSLAEDNNFIRYSVQQIADQMGWHRQTLYRSFTKLKKLAIIIKRPRQRDYQLNPFFFWRGGVVEHKNVLRSADW